ncbi:MAG: type I polyketide synthase [Actinobacteria bacterium]|nr:type I polyketide synthase [Actinomycetota bacterium]
MTSPRPLTSVSATPHAADAPARDPIAIVGIGCRLPGGITDAGEFWRALLEGRDCVVDIPGSRWDPRKFLDPSGRSPGRSYVQKAGMLRHDPREFDPSFFGIPPREAAIMDPQQRMLLQCAWEAFEDAGEPPSRHAGARTGVFVGGFMMDHLTLNSDLQNRFRLGTHAPTAGTLTMLSNRLSYLLDLRGPSVSIDTACSSSMVALHQACQSIWSGESDAALVGGANALLSPTTHVTMAKGRFLSRTGRCQAFSANADGYVRAEGAAVLLVKPLAAARRDGNTVHAIVLGTAANSDGRTNGITVPNGDAQIAVMRTAYAQAGVAPSDVTYVEAHGTGTPVGDPVEARAIGAVVGPNRADGPCRIGSVKTNFGHTEAASGVAGVIKAALCLKYGVVPPHLHLTAVNPAIDLDALNLTIPTEPTPLPRLNGRRVAGVNSFGYGGTNAHVVLAEPPEDICGSPGADAPETPATTGPEPVLVISARSAGALHDLAARHADVLSDSAVEVTAHCRSAAVHRSHHRLRASFPAADRSLLLESLQNYSQESAEAVEPALDSPKVLFVYTGMGPQWWAMGRQLLQTEDVFRSTVLECDKAFRAVSGWSILDELCADENTSKMDRTEVAQPANTVLQIALTRLWQSWGVRPDGVLGHSVGELGAAFGANALSLEETMRVVYHRSRLQATLAGRGSMLAVGLDPDEAEACAQRAGVSVAAVNSTTSVTLAGERAALETIAAELAAAGRFNRMLQVEVPYHSAAMADIKDELVASLGDVRHAAPTVEVYSTALGARLSGARHDVGYWWQNARGTVRFADALKAAVSDGYRVFLEIGPHPVLGAAIRDVLGEVGAKGVRIASLTRGAPESATMRSAFGALYAVGAPIDWEAYFGPGSYVPLPKYPWQNTCLWEENERARLARVQSDRHPMVADVEPGAPRRLISDLSFGAMPYLEDHHAAGTVLFPGSGYVELALAAHADLTGGTACSIEDLELKSAVPLQAESPARLAVSITADTSVVSIHQESDDAAPVLCARGRVFSAGRVPDAVDIAVLHARLAEDMAADTLYAALAKRSLRYGPRFQAVRSVRRTTGEVLATLELPEGVESDGYHLHPVLLDGAFHSLMASVDDGPRQDLIPVRIGRIHYFGAGLPVAYSHGRIVHADTGSVTGDITLLAADGTVVAEITGFTCRLLPRAPRLDQHRRRLHTRRWLPLEEVAIAPTTWLTIAAGDTDSTVLEELSGCTEPVAILDLRWASAPAQDSAPVQAGTSAVEQLLHTVRSLPADTVTRYFVVTRGAEVLDGDSHEPAIDRALLHGFCRTLISERFDLAVTLVDVDGPVDTAELPGLLQRVGAEQEIALRAGRLYCARVDRVPAPNPDESPHLAAVPVSSAPAYALAGGVTGSLENMAFSVAERGDVDVDEVEIDVDLAPLNYKDVLKAMGLVSDRIMQDTFSGAALGMEVVGRISRVGSAVTALRRGDRVYALCPDAIRSHAIVPASRAFALPESVPSEASAGVLAMVTAYHGLVKLAGLQRGETVLIHGATGGVGLAAVALAKWIGAEVIATAGSPEKRDHLRSSGIERVSASRDVTFADDVMAWTQGRGVDVVLNFSPGELMTKSVACLAPFGRFIEIGKMSAEQDTALGLRPFNENLIFASVDLDRLMASRPDYVCRLCDEVLTLIAEKKVEPIPVTVFPAGRIEEAFRLMARSMHMGKVCVDIHDPQLTLLGRSPRRIRQDATYLVTGGLGGFGLETAKWLADEGARHLALVSRRGATATEARETIRHLQVRGVDVRVFAADVGNRDDIAAVLGDIAATMPPLRGVIHSAAVLDDRRIADLDRDALDRVLGPKAQGAMNLHTLTRDLDFFVLYSSISSLFGNPGQGNYVAANSVLDALGTLRRRRGLPASVIQWGVLGETGIVARDANTARHLEHMGLTAISIDDALLALGEVLQHDIDRLTLMEADWPRFAAALPAMAGRCRVALLADAEHGGDANGGATVIDLFAGLADEARRERITALLGEIIAGVMGMDEPDFPLSQPLHEVGLDSIMALEIAAGIETKLGLRLSAVELAMGPSVEQLADIILGRLSGPATQERAA